MAISVRDRKMLWGRAGNRCAFPDCRNELVLPEDQNDPAIIGEEAHIVGQSKDGPRGDTSPRPADVDVYSNLVLMCRNHHRVIDSKANEWPVETLRQIKAEHELWVSTTLSYDPEARMKAETAAGYLAGWEQRVDLDNWDAWTSGLLTAGQPRISKDRLVRLEDAAQWMFRRVWADSESNLQMAFRLFRNIAMDLVREFQQHAVEWGEDAWITETFYKLQYHDQETYERLVSEYNDHVDRVQDLLLELTRAANLVCSVGRADVWPGYRVESGVATVTSGPHSDFGFHTARPEYTTADAADGYYPGRDEFINRVRYGRDRCFGEPPAEE